jgi:hypothetical protein
MPAIMTTVFEVIMIFQQFKHLNTKINIAVIASAFTSRSGPIDCSSYLSATVTPAVSPGSP